MADSRRFVILGASLAGAKAAETLRAEGFDGDVVLVGEEPVRPYERPPLSKGYLRGEEGPEKIYVHGEDYYDEHGIDLRLSTSARGIDPSARTVELDSGERLPYDALLLTVGARPRRLEVPGADLDGVHYLRSVAQSDLLREAIPAAGRVAVIGAGWIGSEVAASARQMGADVALVEMSEVPLERVLGRDIGAFYRDVHVDHGVEMHMGTGIARLTGNKAVQAVELSDGQVLEADLVVVGVGVAPRTELAEAAGLELDNGVVTDQFLATSSPGIYAAGDLAAAWHPVLETRIRLEHWSSALNQGPAAARNMLGQETPYERIPYFFSDQYEIGMEYSGLARDWDEIVLRGDPAEREFVAFWLKDGLVQAGMNVNVWDVADDIAKLVASGRRVDTVRLADPEVALATLLPV